MGIKSIAIMQKSVIKIENCKKDIVKTRKKLIKKSKKNRFPCFFLVIFAIFWIYSLKLPDTDPNSYFLRLGIWIPVANNVKIWPDRKHCSFTPTMFPAPPLCPPHGYVEGSSAPVLDGVEGGEVVRHEGGDLEQVVGPHPSSQQRLVGVPRIVNQSSNQSINQSINQNEIT